MTVRLFATDLDGTLLRSDGTVSDRTRAALKAATDAGLIIAFVTGRPPRWLDDVIEETGHIGLAVGANGAVLYDMVEEEYLTVHTLEPELMVELGTELRSEFPEVQFAVEYGHGFAAEPDYVHDWDINPEFDRKGRRIPEPLLAHLDVIAAQPAMKLLAKDRSIDVDVFLQSALELIGDRASITHSSSFGLLEIAKAGVTKATGLAELATRHGVTHDEVLAIGDMPNDVPMLSWAGHAVAVANAHPEVLAIADEVTESNDEDGVAKALDRWWPPVEDAVS